MRTRFHRVGVVECRFYLSAASLHGLPYPHNVGPIFRGIPFATENERLSCLFDLKRAEIMTDGYDVFVLNNTHVDRINFGSIDESYFLSVGDSLAIGDECFYRLAPDDDELLFYDILYASSGALVGFELRIHCDSVRKRFIDETALLGYVEDDGWPRVWVGRITSGEPKSSTTELFCDLHLCRTPDARWAILIKSDLLVSED